MKLLRRKLFEKVDEAVRANFWPVRRIKTARPTLAIGINQERPAIGGRIWVCGDRFSLDIGVGITYNEAPVHFKVSKTGEDWDEVICQALCWLVHHMPKCDVEWANPQEATR